MLPDIVHVSSAHPWGDNRVHLREAAAAADAGYRVRLIAVESDLGAPPTAVEVVRIPRRARVRRMVVSTTQALALALRSRARVVHLHDPELIWTIPVLRLAGRTVVYDALEDLPDQVWGKDYLTHRQRAVFAWLSHGLLRVAGTANRVVTATEWTGRRFPAPRRIAIHNFPFARPEDDAQVGLEARPAPATEAADPDRSVHRPGQFSRSGGSPLGDRAVPRNRPAEREQPPGDPGGCSSSAGVPGLEPRTTVPETAVLPITPYPKRPVGLLARSPGARSTTVQHPGGPQDHPPGLGARRRRSRLRVRRRR